MTKFPSGYCSVFVAAFACVAVSISAAQIHGQVFSDFNYPGATSTSLYGISGSEIVGTYLDSSNTSHGFLYNGSTFTTLDNPLGGTSTQPTAVSGANIIGSYEDSSHNCDGFLYNGSTYVTLNYPGALNTAPSGISGNTVVGMYCNGAGGERGFIYNGSAYVPFDYMGDAYSLTWVTGISGNNIVGTFGYDCPNAEGFLYNGSTFTTIGDPLGWRTEVNAVSGNNIVGTYYTGYSSTVEHGFFYNGSTYITLDDPLGVSTYAYGVSGNEVVGTYYDSSYNAHGYIAYLPGPSTCSQWVSALGGNWSDASKWNVGVPNAVGTGAVFTVLTAAAVTVTLDVPVTLSGLQFGNSGSTSTGYILSGAGTNTLTLANSGAGTTITVSDGTHAIDAPVILANTLVVSGLAADSWTLTFGTASSITDNGGGFSLTMSASNGTLILSGSDNYSGGTIVTAGTLIVTNADALPSGTSLTVGAGGTFIFDPSQAVAAPIISSTASQTNAVPEPGTLALLTVAVCGAAVYHRVRSRRKKQ